MARGADPRSYSPVTSPFGGDNPSLQQGLEGELSVSERMDEGAAASRLMDMAIAHWAGELLLQAAEMSLADKFAGDAPRSAAEIAAEYGMLPRPTRRFLRALAGLGLLASAGGDAF